MTMKTLTTREIRECLGTNKARIQHWGRLMKIEPVDRGSMGRDALYTNHDLLCFLLCQRMFELVGLSVTVSAQLVVILRRELTREQMGRMKQLNLVVSTTKPRETANLIGFVEMTSRDHKQRRKRGYIQIRRRKEAVTTKPTAGIAARLVINLEDLHKKAKLVR